eukprot:6078846-Karenia_brevis.AAC.1
MHKEYAVYSCVTTMIRRLQEDGEVTWERSLRQFLGLSGLPSSHPQKQPLICERFGEPFSEDRGAAGNDAEACTHKTLSEEQRQCLLSVNTDLATVTMVPGAGKTIIETLAH